MTTFYICTIKNFNIPEGLKGNYKIITDGTDLNNTYPYPIIKADNELTPMKHAYSEGHMIYDIWKNDTESSMIGINHYRRYLDVQFKEEIKENVLPIPMAFDVYNQYAACHNISDLNECLNIINKYYPEYNPNIPLVGLYACNICVLERDIFNEWCKFIFGVLDIFNERRHFTCDADVKKYTEQYFPNNVEYQSRIQAFLMERLSTIFFTKKFNEKPIRLSQIIMT